MSGLFLHRSPVEFFETVSTDSGTLAYIASRKPPALVSSALRSQFHLAVPPSLWVLGGLSRLTRPLVCFPLVLWLN